MAKSISTVAVTDTFQTWLNKTNELVGLVNSDVITASAGAGDTTVGNAKLTGNFTANNFTANTVNGLFTGFGLRTSSIGQQTGNTTPIAVSTALGIDADRIGVSVNHSTGGRIRFSNPNRNWDVGHGAAAANSSLSFIWNDVLVGALTTAGALELLGGLSANANSSFGSGGIKIGSGTVALPALSWSAEANTGIYRPGANTIGFAVWGAHKLAISNSAITANAQVLGINGSASAPAYAFSANNDSGMYVAGGLLRFAVGGSENISMDSVGNFNLSGTGTAVALRTITNSALDLDASHSVGIRIGKNSNNAILSVLRPLTTSPLVQLEANNDVSANGGYVRVWQGPGLANTPAFAFIGDPTTGFARLAANTIGFVSGAVTQMSIGANNIGIRAGAGIKFGNLVAPGGVGDVSAHLDLYGSAYGFAVTSGTLNLVSPVTGRIIFASNTGITSGEFHINSGNGVIRLGGATSASTPQYSFIDDTDTGIWRYASNGLGITTGGVERARFGTVSQFFGTAQANSFNLINAAGDGGGFLGVAADSETNPSFSWSGDTDTGLWRYGSNSIGFTTGGVNRAVFNVSGITLQNDGRFIASNRQDVANPDYCFTGAGGYGMWYQSNYIRFSAAGSNVLSISDSLMYHYVPNRFINGSSANPAIYFGANNTNGIMGNSTYVYNIVNNSAAYRFDNEGGAASSVINRSLGDARYQRTSSRRFKDNIAKINNTIEKKLLDAFDKFDLKTWVWGGEIAEHDERRGTVGIGLIAEELETYLKEAVRYQWVDGPTPEDEKKKPTKKQANALDDSPILAALILKIRQLEARLEEVGG